MHINVYPVFTVIVFALFYSDSTELTCRTEKDHGIARLNHRTAGTCILTIIAQTGFISQPQGPPHPQNKRVLHMQYKEDKNKS